MFLWTLSAPSLEGLSRLWQAWHSTPATCRDQLVHAASFCLGSGYDRQLVVALEALVIGLLFIVAFLAGRFTADWQLGARVTPDRNIVLVGTPRSRFDEADRGFGAGHSRAARDGPSSRFR